MLEQANCLLSWNKKSTFGCFFYAYIFMTIQRLA